MLRRKTRKARAAQAPPPLQPPAPPPPPQCTSTDSKSCLFTDAYAISLPELFPQRFPRIQTWATAAKIPLQLWHGVRVTPADKPSLPLKGIGTTHFEDRTRTSFNLGVIGAFLAHRNLLEHLLIVGAGKPGTLIFEDDVYIPSDFYAKLAEAEKTLPPDWDIVFLDKYKEDGTLVNPQWMRIHKDMTAKRSWGIWSYIVRHSSLPKILAKLEHMLDVPDIQLNKFADELRMYLVRPSICRPDSLTAAQSVVTELDKQK